MVCSVDLESCQYAAYHNFPFYPFLFNQSISRHVSDEFPVVFPPYITMVWYLCLVKGGIIQVLCLFWMVR